MKIKTSELTGRALAWAVDTVADCRMEIQHTKNVVILSPGVPRTTPWAPQENWAQGGPIIERRKITLRTNACVPGHWAAFIDFGGSNTNVKARQSGPTPLIAAMRCFVASKLGDEVEIPDELLGETK